MRAPAIRRRRSGRDYRLRTIAKFYLPPIAFGLLWSPSRMVRAFRAGRRSCTLHGDDDIDAPLAMPLRDARARLLRRVDKTFPR